MRTFPTLRLLLLLAPMLVGAGEKTLLKAKLWAYGNTLIPAAAGLAISSQGHGHDAAALTGVGLMTYGMIFGPASGSAYLQDYQRYIISTSMNLAFFGLSMGAGSRILHPDVEKRRWSIAGFLVGALACGFWSGYAIDQGTEKSWNKYLARFSVSFAPSQNFDPALAFSYQW